MKKVVVYLLVVGCFLFALAMSAHASAYETVDKIQVFNTTSGLLMADSDNGDTVVDTWFGSDIMVNATFTASGYDEWTALWIDIDLDGYEQQQDSAGKNWSRLYARWDSALNGQMKWGGVDMPDSVDWLLWSELGNIKQGSLHFPSPGVAKKAGRDAGSFLTLRYTINYNHSTCLEEPDVDPDTTNCGDWKEFKINLSDIHESAPAYGVSNACVDPDVGYGLPDVLYAGSWVVNTTAAGQSLPSEYPAFWIAGDYCYNDTHLYEFSCSGYKINRTLYNCVAEGFTKCARAYSDIRPEFCE